MSKILGISQRAAVAALEKAGFEIIRQSAHIIMSNGIGAALRAICNASE